MTSETKYFKTDGFIPKKDYIDVIKQTQIISTDFLIFNTNGQVLLGKRLNEPAKGTWFVPGGRVHKHELIDDAVKRITQQELGKELKKTSDLGVYHHIYPNNFANNDHGTHYVVFAVNIVLDENVDELDLVPDDQHSMLKWWDVREILSHDEIHLYTKNYFHPAPYNKAFFT
tara:strand:+ start:40 stop:555 length:516 start_codon:yes stop_codon:yes gene_type:complete